MHTCDCSADQRWDCTELSHKPYILCCFAEQPARTRISPVRQLEADPDFVCLACTHHRTNLMVLLLLDNAVSWCSAQSSELAGT